MRARQKENINLLNLPNEILFLFLKDMSFSGLFLLREVSQRFKTIVDVIRVKKEFNFYPDDELDPSEIFQLLTHYQQKYHLNLGSCFQEILKNPSALYEKSKWSFCDLKSESKPFSFQIGTLSCFYQNLAISPASKSKFLMSEAKKENQLPSLLETACKLGLYNTTSLLLKKNHTLTNPAAFPHLKPEISNLLSQYTRKRFQPLKNSNSHNKIR